MKQTLRSRLQEGKHASLLLAASFCKHTFQAAVDMHIYIPTTQISRAVQTNVIKCILHNVISVTLFSGTVKNTKSRLSSDCKKVLGINVLLTLAVNIQY